MFTWYLVALGLHDDEDEQLLDKQTGGGVISPVQEKDQESGNGGSNLDKPESLITGILKIGEINNVLLSKSWPSGNISIGYSKWVNFEDIKF